jgi:hypothetical protein
MSEQSGPSPDMLAEIKAAIDRLAEGRATRARRPRLTVTAVAEEANVHRSTIYEYEAAINYLAKRQADSPAGRLKQLQDEIDQLKEEHRGEVERYREVIEILAQRIQVLSVVVERAQGRGRGDILDLPTARGRGDA